MSKMSIVAFVLTLITAFTAEAGPFRERREERRQQYQQPTYQYQYQSTETVTASGSLTASPTPNVGAAPTGAFSDDALGEVNARRAEKGLRPFIRDEGLTQAAIAAARHMASFLIWGHTENTPMGDFQFLPPGISANAAGCGALTSDWGWQSCCTYDNYTYAGAAWYYGRNGLRYTHIFVR